MKLKDYLPSLRAAAHGGFAGILSFGAAAGLQAAGVHVSAEAVAGILGLVVPLAAHYVPQPARDEIARLDGMVKSAAA